ncbi:TPA: hypothetical protein SLC38_001456 [Morganella morganii]|uniref:ABC-three component system middle component 5 n=1 Tax=Morganella morganii TaxID=582 RepID=UPI0029C3FD5A|nr:hypothetical protein [Morganella morganii]
MLIYHPAFDAYHCLFRMIAIIEKLNYVEVEKIRILDFYMIFPSLVSKIRMPVTFNKEKKEARKYTNEYRDPISPLSTFRDMHQIQISALKCLAGTGLIDMVKLEHGFVIRTEMKIPDNLLLLVNDFLNEKPEIYSFILDTLSQFHLLGKDGLKDRTELMEYRYDFT